MCDITDRVARFGLKFFSLRELIGNSPPLLPLSAPSFLLPSPTPPSRVLSTSPAFCKFHFSIYKVFLLLNKKIARFGLACRATAEEEGLRVCARRRAAVRQRGELRATDPENASPRARARARARARPSAKGAVSPANLQRQRRHPPPPTSPPPPPPNTQEPKIKRAALGAERRRACSRSECMCVIR